MRRPAGVPIPITFGSGRGVDSDVTATTADISFEGRALAGVEQRTFFWCRIGVVEDDDFEASERRVGELRWVVADDDVELVLRAELL